MNIKTINILVLILALILTTRLQAQTNRDSVNTSKELKKLIEKSKRNQRRNYNLERKDNKKISLVDYSNISGTKSIQLETGLIVPAYFTKNKFRLNTYSVQWSTIGRSNKNAYYGGVRYITNKNTERYFQYYLAEGGCRWYLFSIPLFDFRFDTGLGMGVADKQDYRIGKQNTYYALCGKLGIQSYLKLHTYFYIVATGSVISIYDTKTVNTNAYLTVGIKVML